MKKEEVMHKTSIGGQAVIEGVMMRGVHKTALAVRKPDGEIVIEDVPTKVSSSKVKKIPIVRGVVSFVESLILGYKTLTRSAEIAEEGLTAEIEEEPSKFEKFLTKIFGDKLFDAIMYFSVVLGLLFAVLLFTVLPAYTTKGLDLITGGGLGWAKSLIEGIVRIIIFLIYLILVGRMKDMQRVFEYHGAEHKTIFCYEKGLPLTAENIKMQKRFHPRCGTSFLIIVMIVSILIFSLPIFPWDNILLRIGLKILMLPVVAGLSYEIIKIAGRYDNIVTRIISAPGVALQRITTREPDESQIEVAAESLKAVLTDDRNEDKW